jgi:hypothetical protein
MQAQRIVRVGEFYAPEKRFSSKPPEKRETAPIVRCQTIAPWERLRPLESEEYVYNESSIAESHFLRESTVREDIARRLKGVCSNFSDDEFDGLVKLMAARQVRCERRQSW